MTGRVRLGNERRLAFVVLCAGMLASFWMQREAVAVDSSVSARRQQLEHLRTLTDPLRAPCADGHTGDALRGVVPGYRVEWLDTRLGPMLGIESVEDPKS